MAGHCFTLLALLAGASAHVSMVYQEGQPAGIRNANGPTGDGQASVASPCGGARTFGSNGIGTIQDGDTVTLAMRYAAGHNGQFRMAFACGGGDGSALEANTAVVPPANCQVTGAGSDYTNGGADAIGQSTMTFTCQLPPVAALATPGAQPQECTMGILDQRDWGGCVDVNVVSAADPLPPSPPPAPFVAATGRYYFTEAGRVDTSAGEKPMGLFSCCALSGYLEIPAHTEGQTTVAATFNAQATGCPATVPNTAQAPPANTATYTVTSTMTMAVSNNGNKCAAPSRVARQQLHQLRPLRPLRRSCPRLREKFTALRPLAPTC